MSPPKVFGPRTSRFGAYLHVQPVNNLALQDAIVVRQYRSISIVVFALFSVAFMCNILVEHHKLFQDSIF
jgi:hypothetical protein